MIRKYDNYLLHNIKFERVFALPSKNTFSIPPVRKLIQEERLPGLTIDPFPFESKEDCFDYLSRFDDECADFALVDPPYTKRQVSEHYKKNNGLCSSWQTSSGWTAKVKREVARVLKPGGKSITFGYNTNGLGKVNGMELIRILDVYHGGDHYDLLCTVEIKAQATLRGKGNE